VPIFIDINVCKIVVRIFDATISNVTITLKDKLTKAEKTLNLSEGSHEITPDFILERKEYITTNIPKKIYQTSSTYNLSKDCIKTIDTIKDFNPDYEYYFFDDNDIYKFMLLHYGETSQEINALNWLEPGAYRADLFRYCILNLQGGIYADCKQMWRTDFDSILSTGNNYYYVKDSGNNLVYNALLITIPNTIVLKMAIEEIKRNVKLKRYIPSDSLGITGPNLIGKEVKRFVRDYEFNIKHIVIDHFDNYENPIINVKTNEILAFKAYPTYFNDRVSKHYSQYYMERNVYQYKVRCNN
jgi:mannosyltransferase OCH1-like enzyme